METSPSTNGSVEDLSAQTKQNARKTAVRLGRTMVRTLRLSWDASRRGVVGLLALTIGAAVTAPLVVAISRRVVDLIASAAGFVQAGAPKMPLGRVLPWAIALGFLGAVQRVLAGIQSNKQQVFSREVTRHAAKLFLVKTSQSELARFDDPQWHDRVSRANTDLNYRPFNLTYTTIGIVGSVVTLAGMLGVLLSLHPLLLVLAVLSVVIPMPFQRRVNRKIYEFHFNWTSKQRRQGYLRWLLSDTRAAKELRAFVLERELLARHDELAANELDELKRIYSKADRVTALGGFLGGLVMAGAYVFVAVRGVAGELSPGDVTALIAATASVTAQISSISSSFIAIDQNAPFLEDFFDFLKVEPLITVIPEPKRVPSPVRGGIEFDHVRFAYPQQEVPAVEDFTLRIEDGELVALVGDNGAGKTTLVKLLLRFYDPQGGSVRIGGVDLRETDPVDLRGGLGVLFQDYQSYPFSVRENIQFGRIGSDATDMQIWDALTAARADEIVKKFPDGLDATVGRYFEGGQDLSGGEWQRLALARLMFRDADIWILDEPTSSLDPEAEAAIFSELKQQLHGRIGIVISHRFSTVRIADRIAVVQDGRITELGSHHELMALGGRYAHLFELQAAAYR